MNTLLPIGLLYITCQPAAGSPELTTGTTDAGGSLTSGGEVEISGSLGGFGGLASDAGTVIARAGFPGQIYDPAGVAITPDAAALQENALVPFTAEVLCDDDTLLPSFPVEWSVDSLLLHVSAGGEVSTGLVPGAFTAALTATAGGVSGIAMLTITDTDPDNYGGYAADGLPDAWQVLHFGYRSGDAGPTADPDADGQENQTEWLAGTDPTDPKSLLHIAFSGVPPSPGTVTLKFSPHLPGRTYSLEGSNTLQALWTPLPGLPVNGESPNEGLLTDTSATEPRKLYRLRITIP